MSICDNEKREWVGWEAKPEACLLYQSVGGQKKKKKKPFPLGVSDNQRLDLRADMELLGKKIFRKEIRQDRDWNPKSEKWGEVGPFYSAESQLRRGWAPVAPKAALPSTVVCLTSGSEGPSVAGSLVSFVHSPNIPPL